MQIRDFCEKYNLFGLRQHGFRSNKGTSSAVISVVTHWNINKYKRKYQGTLFFDLTAAYDTLDPGLFIKKIQLLGFDETSIRWFQSYLIGRKMCVSVAGFLSLTVDVPWGTPQGSSISCSVFIISIMYYHFWTDAYIVCFADDTCLTVTGTSKQEVVEKLEKAANDMLSYYASNGMVANGTKTKITTNAQSANE